MRLILLLGITVITSCYKTKVYDVKMKPTNYKVVKVDVKKTQCQLANVNFQLKDDGVFLDKNEFTKLTQNINNFNICYNNFIEKTKVDLSYYEDVIQTLGGEFEQSSKTK